MFRNPFGRTARIGSLALGFSLSGLLIPPVAAPVAAASRAVTISPAPIVPSFSVQRVFAHVPRIRLKRQNPLAGLASWYGAVLHGHRSADGGIFDEAEFTAAHNSLPFGTHVRVTDVGTGRSVIVRITDRGILAPGRIIDLSSAAAEDLGILSAGVAQVRLEVLGTEQAAKDLAQ